MAKRGRWVGAIVFGVLGAGTPIACSDNGAVTLAPGGDGGQEASAPPGAGVGQHCDAATPCRAGLACNGGVCAPSHAGGDGTPCTISAECKAGDYCGSMRTCTGAGRGGDGDACKSDADCQSGLRCDVVGFGLACKPEGMVDVGGACATSADCFGALACVNKSCAPLPPGTPGPAIGLPTWKGADCADDPGPTKAYFRVPRGTNDGDFYRLPFPNDVRLKNGHPDLSGHPSPGTELLGFDPVDRYLRDVEKNTDGFSSYATVFFRFSAPVDFDSLKKDGALKLVDVTAGAGNDLGFSWSATSGRGRYICNDYLSLRPSDGAPFAPGHTYAVIMTSVAVDKQQQAIAVSPDLTALLAPTPPSDVALAAAYAAYAPLRAWAATKSFALSTVLNATVFTVGHPDRPASKLPAAVAAAAAPTATGWVKCGSGPSPCPQATGDRACGAADPAFDELHALVTLPIFQKGAAPYTTLGDGDLALAADGTPQLQGTAQVCMALTVPKGATMPASGWPLVVYAHGTGGSFRSHVTEGVAARLASVDDGAGGQMHVAVLGIDQVEHGTRRGTSNDSPNNLFFDFANPSAARGNPLQGAADQLALLRFAAGLDLPAASSPTGAEIKLGKIAFWGHSQGATAGGIAMPYAAGVAGVVVSGEGASLLDALVGKKSPVDIADALPIVLVEPTGVDANHPVLSILQNAIDVADPLNHAGAFLAATAPAGATTKHVFQPYGLGDTFAPPSTERVFALAAGLGVATPPAGVTADPISGAMLLPVPAGANFSVMGAMFTGIVREYAPSGYDGHFVAFKDASAKADVDHFLADVLAGKVPKVGR